MGKGKLAGDVGRPTDGEDRTVRQSKWDTRQRFRGEEKAECNLGVKKI